MFRLVSLLAICLGVTGCSYSNVNPYPHSWSALPALSNGCSEIFGQYQEANPKESGNEVPSRWAFYLKMSNDLMRSGDKTVESREIRITQEIGASIKISYLIDGKKIADQLIPSGEYICKSNGLQLTYRNEYGMVYRDLPNFGKTHTAATLWRDNEYLYVKVTNKTFAIVLYTIPSWGTSESWYRFPAQTRAAT